MTIKIKKSHHTFLTQRCRHNLKTNASHYRYLRTNILRPKVQSREKSDLRSKAPRAAPEIRHNAAHETCRFTCAVRDYSREQFAPLAKFHTISHASTAMGTYDYALIKKAISIRVSSRMIRSFPFASSSAASLFWSWTIVVAPWHISISDFSSSARISPICVCIRWKRPVRTVIESVESARACLIANHIPSRRRKVEENFCSSDFREFDRSLTFDERSCGCV